MAASSSSSVQLNGSEQWLNLPQVPDTNTNDFPSDEESFVVLGHSLDCDVNASLINTPVAGKNIIDRIEQSVDNVLATLSDTSSELPLPALENHFQTKKNLDSVTAVSSNLSSDEIEKKVSSLIEENQQLKSIILQNNMSMKSQYQRIVAWRDDVEKTYQVHKQKFEEAKAYINSLKSEIKDLNKTVEAQAKEISDLKSARLDICTEKLDELSLNKSLDEKLLNLEKLLAESRAKNEGLELEIQRLQSLLEKTQGNVRERADSNPMEESKIVDCISAQEEMKKMRHQLMEAQQKITELECNKNMYINQLANKDKQISNLQDLLEQFKYTEDDVFALKEQVELYKADFETEHRAKESFRFEKEQMADDVKNLQDRNRKLQEEVEVYRSRSGYVYVPEARSSSASSRTTSSEMPTAMFCPKCNVKFYTYQALENHVFRCLELDK